MGREIYFFYVVQGKENPRGNGDQERVGCIFCFFQKGKEDPVKPSDLGMALKWILQREQAKPGRAGG